MEQRFTWQYRANNFAGREWNVHAPRNMIILVHGIGEHTGRYQDMAAYFNKQGYGVIGIDHYGHGGSDGKRGASKGFKFYFEYLEAFIHYVNKRYAVPSILYGHSMGGGIVCGIILRSTLPIQGAVVTSPALLTYRHVPSYLFKVLAVLNYFIPHLRINQGLDIRKLSHDLQIVEAFKSDPLNHHKMSIRLVYTMLSNGYWCLAHAHLLKKPMLLLHGDADEFTNVTGSRKFAQAAPKQLLTYKEWAGGFHELHNEPINEEVLAFIGGWLHSLNG